MNEKALEAATKRKIAHAICLVFQGHDLGKEMPNGDFRITTKQIDLLERLCDEAAEAAIAAYIAAWNRRSADGQRVEAEPVVHLTADEQRVFHDALWASVKRVAPEPVAWRYRDAWGRWAYCEAVDNASGPTVITEKQPLFASPPSPGIAEGWRLVPNDATADMTADAARHALSVEIGSEYPWPQYMADLWKVMLSAAPPPPTKEG